MRPAAAALLLLAACGESPAGDSPSGAGSRDAESGAAPARHALLITLDTTRPDALSLYGYRSPATPHIDALAAEGVTYDVCRAVAPITLPSHASMLTGLYPLRHGVRANGFGRLPAEAVTLAERARAADLDTAAFVAATVLDRRFGLDQGFEVYDQITRAGAEHSSVMPSRAAPQVADAALAWLAARDPERRFFLWVHFFDPHAPYEPPQRFMAVAAGNPYVAEVAAVDHEIGRLLAALRESGELDDTAVVIVADHGEDMYAHGEPTHAVFCYDSSLRVPLVVRRPDRRRAGERSDEVVSVADVGPTLATALGLASLGDVDGLSLWDAPVPADRGVYFESYYGFLFYGWSPIAGWADAEGKYLHGPAPELYDTRADFLEQRNLYPADTARGGRYRERLAELASRPRLAEQRDVELDGELLRDLASLGYASAPPLDRTLPGPLEDSRLPAPRLEELLAVLAATSAADRGRCDEAVELLIPIVLENPRNVTAHDELGKCLGRLERWSEALDVLQRLLALDDSRPAVHINLAVAYEATGRPDLALPHARRGVEIDPEHRLGRINLARILDKLGKAQEAAAVRASLEQ